MSGSLIRYQDIDTTRNLTFGNVFVLNEIAKRLKMDEILGNDKQGKLALWQAIAFLINSSSHRPSTKPTALDLAKNHAIYGVLGLSHISESEVAANLNWLLSKQKDLEQTFGKLKGKSDLMDAPHPGYKMVELLATAMMQYLKTVWRCIARTVRYELSSLAYISVVEISVGNVKQVVISTPHPSTQDRLDMLGIKLPKNISIQSCKII